MAYRGSAYFKGNSRKPFPSGFNVGATLTVFHTHVMDKDDLQPADVLELIPLPAGARVIALNFASENLPAGNGTIGLMSGNPGEPDGNRTVGTELVNAVAHAATDGAVTMVTLSAAALAVPSDTNRSIGFRTSVAIPVAANRRLHIRVTYQF